MGTDTAEADLYYDPTSLQLKELEDFAAARPHIADIIRTYTPWHCYRINDLAGDPLRKGHYAIVAWSDDRTMRIVHGSDSFMPGLSVFGIQPSDLMVCDCGKFRYATDAQLKRTKRALDAYERTGRHAPCGDPRCFCSRHKVGNAN